MRGKEHWSKAVISIQHYWEQSLLNHMWKHVNMFQLGIFWRVKSTGVRWQGIALVLESGWAGWMLCSLYRGFFFANLKDERDPFVQQMIGVQKFTCFCYCISYLDIQCRVGSLLLDIINFGSPFYFPGVHLARAMLGCHLWFPSKLSKVC